MRVNALKTQMIYVSDARDYRPAAFIREGEGQQVNSVKLMKILGFRFSSKPNMNPQVTEIKRKMRARTWVLHHLGSRNRIC